jgi:hypothetical protein
MSPDGEPRAQHRRAYGYLRKHLLMFDSELSRAEERLAHFADATGLELAAVFVEEIETVPAAFERFIRAVILDQVEVVLLPSLLHFAVLGAPGRIKENFEDATGARVVTTLDAISYEPGEAVS